jgi:hypothetical protein
MNALADQIEHARVLLAALVPASDTDAAFSLTDGAVPLDQDMPALRRRVAVTADDSPSTTLSWFGQTRRLVRSAMRVTVAYDSLGDHARLQRMLVEDRDAIVSLMESPSSRVSSSVYLVRHTDAATVRPGDGETFSAVSLGFDVDYLLDVA